MIMIELIDDSFNVLRNSIDNWMEYLSIWLVIACVLFWETTIDQLFQVYRLWRCSGEPLTFGMGDAADALGSLAVDRHLYLSSEGGNTWGLD